MLAVRLLLGAALFVLTAVPAAYAGAGGLDFLDRRPVVIPLDDAEPGQRWAVQVLNMPDGNRDVTMHVVFEPAGVITATRNPVVTDGGMVEFVIELERAVEGSGELVAVAGDAVARRPISTQFRSVGPASAVGSLQFSGQRIAPFTGLVRIPSLEIPADTSGADAAPQRIGLLTSERGDVAELVRQGNEFTVVGVRRVGEFTGTVDVLPDGDGGDVEATVRVRDIAAWPLAVLLAGLSVAHLLDRYQRRQRPQRLHERRLAGLRNQALAASRLTGGRLRISGTGLDELLLDQLITEARSAFHPLMAEAEQASWEPGGTDYQRLAEIVARFRQLCQSFRGLQDVRLRVIDSTEPDDRERIGRALDRSVVGIALRDRSIRSQVDLAEAERPLADARRYLDDFADIYRTIMEYRRHHDPAARAHAAEVLALLCRAPRDLQPVQDAADDLDERWSRRLAKAPVGYPPPPAIGVPGAPPPSMGLPGASHAPTGPPPTRKRRPPLGVVAALAAAAFVAVSVITVTLVAEPDMEAGPDPAHTPTSTPTTSPGTPAPAIPNAPVAALADAPVAPVLDVTTPDGGQLVWFGVVVPIVLAGALAALAWLVARWRRRRTPSRPAVLIAEAIDADIRREDLRFSLIAGVLVVLSGMSVLYVSNPTFGTAGDYLALGLWGAAFGEGLQLARRLWPSLPRL